MKRASAFLLLCAACATAPVAQTSPAPASTPPAADPKPPALRLPPDVVARSNRLELTVVPEQPKLSGKIRIEAEVKQSTGVVWLNATDLEVKSAKLAGAPARVIRGDDDFIGLVAEKPLPVGALNIDVEFTAGIDHQRSRGVYAEKEGADTYAYTFFEAIDARRAFPCFDEPGSKVPWKLVLHVKKTDVALANTPIELEADEPDGMKEVQFETTPPLPSYLVAFVVGPFEVVDGGSAAGVPIRFIVPKGRESELGWAKESTPKSLAALVAWFGAGYPFKKLDVAVVPRFWGTMEHPGLVAMGQPLTLIRPEEATRERKQSYLNILSHEVAHYWFGDWVTTAWWNDTWLNEALGEWMDLIITDAAMPSWQVMDERVDQARRAMSTDELLTTRAIRQPVESKEAIEASFDGDITYLKGSSVLRMFEAAIGAPKWQAFIRRYLGAHQWGNATADDFVAAMKADLGAQAADGFNSFLTQPGVPLVMGELSCKGQPTLSLSQKRSLPQGVKEPGAPEAWPVPVCLRYGDAKTSHRTCVQLSPVAGGHIELPLEGKCPTWVLLNDDARGYYRSAVDAKLVRELFTKGSALAKQVKPSVAERKMLMADVHSAVTRGDLGVVEALALGPLAVNDPSDRVALDAVELMALREDVLDDAAYAKAMTFYLQTFGPLARKLTWKRGKDDSDDRHKLRQRALAIAVHADEPVLLAEGAKLARAWLDDPKKAGLEDDLVPLALQAAAKHGDETLYERYLAAARGASDRNQKQRLLVALAGFTEPKLVARTLELTRGTADFDVRETFPILMSLPYERQARAQAWAWAQKNLDALLSKMRNDEASWLLGAFPEAFCDAQHRAELDALLTPRAAKIDGAQAQVSRGLENVDRCIAKEARDKDAIAAFLAAIK